MSEYKIWCNDRVMATTSGPDERAQVEAFRYANQYREEGRVTITKAGKMVAILSATNRPIIASIEALGQEV